MMNIAQMLGRIRRAAASQNSETRPGKVFDWEKAALILADKRIMNAEVGLDEDWGWTSDTLIADGLPNRDCGAYLHSIWATPVIKLDDDTTIECWRPSSEVEDLDAVWPESALNILFPPQLATNAMPLLEKPKDAD